MTALGSEDEDGAQLIRRLRAEQRELQEVVETEAEQLARARRGLGEVMLEYMYRGDTVRLATGTRAWTGQVVHVAKSLVPLRTASGDEATSRSIACSPTWAVVSTGGYCSRMAS